MKNPDNCECAHYVVPAPFSMTSRGWGCRYTGGHCLPSEKCDNMERVYIAESRQSVELLDSKNLIATDFNL